MPRFRGGGIAILAMLFLAVIPIIFAAAPAAEPPTVPLLELIDTKVMPINPVGPIRAIAFEGLAVINEQSATRAPETARYAITESRESRDSQLRMPPVRAVHMPQSAFALDVSPQSRLRRQHPLHE